MTNRPSPPLIKYPGSKHTLAPRIVEYIPTSADSYLEPYAGGAAVLFGLPQRYRLEALNDLSQMVYNFLTVFRSQPEALIEAIRWTPGAVQEHALALQPTDDPLEAARRFYFRCWASFRPFDPNPTFRRQYRISRGRNGQSAPMTTGANQFRRIDHLEWYAERLRGTVIENLDALDFIARYDYETAVLYVDPPYFSDARARTQLYDKEMPEEQGHRALALALRSAQGMVVLSGRPCDLYAELYEAHGWQRVDMETRQDGGGMATESVWLSPRTQSALARERQEREAARYPLLAEVDLL